MTSSAGSVFVSSSVFKQKTVTAVVDECEYRGITQLELTSSFPPYDGVRSEVVAARRRGMRLLIHNYFPPPARGFVINLASGDPDILARSIEHCRMALTLSAEIGAPWFSVHAGFAADPRPSELGGTVAVRERRTKTEAAETFYETLAELCAFAEAVGIDLLVENNVISASNLTDGRNELALCVTGDEMCDMFAAVANRRLGLLLDVAHLHVSANALGFDRARTIQAVRGQVRALHLSANDGMADDNQPFERGAWFLAHLADFVGTTCVIETRPLDQPALAACITLVEESLGKH